MSDNAIAYLRRCVIGLPIGVAVVYVVCSLFAYWFGLPESFAVSIALTTGILGAIAVVIGVVLRINRGEEPEWSFTRRTGRWLFSPLAVTIFAFAGALFVLAGALAYLTGDRTVGVLMYLISCPFLVMAVGCFWKSLRIKASERNQSATPPDEE